MRTKLWIGLTLLLIVPGLLSTVSCAKKKVQYDTSLTEFSEAESAKQAAAEEAARQRQRQREIEERKIEAAQTAARNMFVNEDIHFEFDRSSLLPSAQNILKKKAAWLRDNPDVSVIIEGHCDERGTNEYNLALGDRRAQSTKNFLVDLGIEDTRLTAISYGEERPVDTGHNEGAWSKNRRAHFVIE
jgi:peptidoglycan-associated lipoprotein